MTMPAVVDFYGECIDALIFYIRASMTDIFPVENQIGRNDAQLNTGADNFLFFRPGSFNIVGPGAPSPNRLIKDYAWVALGDLYARYTEYETSWAAFEKVRATLIWIININPALAMFDNTKAKNIRDVTVEALGDALPWQSTKGFGAYIIQRLRFTVIQRVTFPLYVKRSIQP